MEPMGIIKHGIKWYFDDGVPYCPECRTIGVDHFNITRDIIYEEKSVITVTCENCGCVFYPQKNYE